MLAGVLHAAISVRVGLISDLHGNFEGTAAALRQLDDCERILCAGDIFNQYGGDPRVVDLLRERGVDAVAGNHDVQFVRSALHAEQWQSTRAYLAGLPAQRIVDSDGCRIHLVHGAPWDPAPDWSTYLFPHMLGDTRLAGVEGVLVVGHTHVPYVRRAHAHLLVASPGSCGVIDADGRIYAAVLDTRTLDVQLLPFRLRSPIARAPRY
jgi:putative phosphoesterase